MSFVCLLSHEAFCVKWRFSIITAKFPNKYENVRNVEVKLVPSLGKFEVYKPVKPNYPDRYILSLVLSILTEEQENHGKKTAELSFQNDEKKDDDKDINDEQAHDDKQEDM